MATKFEKDFVLRDEVECHDNAIIVPTPMSSQNSPVQQSGVFDAAGRFLDASVTFRPESKFNSEPPFPPPEAITDLPGTYMYGGVLFGHFGHFLMDSLARIWAYGDLKGKIDGVVFTPKMNGRNVDNMLKVQLSLMQALGIDCEVRLVREPTRVDRIYVPWQGIGIGSGWEIASDRFRTYMQDHGGKHIAPKGADRIYISRSALPKARASFLSEKLLEAHLEAAGYTVIHPQKMSKSDQVAQYRQARWIVSPDGSPLHLLAYVGHADQKVAVIARRSATTHHIFESQLKAFTGGEAVTINCLTDDWIPGGVGRPGRSSWGELDLTAVYEGLNAAGFLPEGTPPWPAATEDEIAQEIAAISEREGIAYRRYQAPLPT